ncbi:MAG TPA: DNA-formamidopyrimidine glycosylase, partial [Dehalococcoidia bacterium]|nr:DNA-formamidopyrimidine glycosylase [Dehalococcoidia bacterium]
MPELPEVETIRRELERFLPGRTIGEAAISPEAPRLVHWPPQVAEFCRGLEGQRIEATKRRGKYLLFRLSDGKSWVVHLRMTGALLHRPQGCASDAFVRATFRLDDGTWLCFRDVRKFGMMWLVDDPEEVVGKLGPEPLGNGFSPADLAGLSRRRAPIKAVLLDQTTLAGLGNIYADEALFEARIHPQRLASSLSEEEVSRLQKAIVNTLNRAMADRGSSFDSYVDPKGEK